MPSTLRMPASSGSELSGLGYWVGPIIFLTEEHDLQLYMFLKTAM
jgi:hypothetical protein